MDWIAEMYVQITYFTGVSSFYIVMPFGICGWNFQDYAMQSHSISFFAYHIIWLSDSIVIHDLKTQL
jgi:hypothetical protein